MHIGIMGTGFGKYHGDLYQKIDPSIKLTYWGRNDEKLKMLQSELSCDYTTDMNEFLENKAFDFIDICLPSQVHAEYALRALELNHSVFLETPAVTSLEDGIKIKKVAQETGKKVLVNRFLLTDPYYRMIYDLSQSKKYGELKHIEIFRRTPPIWGKLGNDTISTALMIHDLDFATWLGKDLKLNSFAVATNSDNSGAVIDCLLSDGLLNIHVQGNSMLSMGSPFSVGYEATFENATISYFEDSSRDAVDSECYIYSGGEKEKVTFEPEEHCKDLLRKVIKDFSDQKGSDLSIENALPALSIAFELSGTSSR